MRDMIKKKKRRVYNTNTTKQRRRSVIQHKHSVGDTEILRWVKFSVYSLSSQTVMTDVETISVLQSVTMYGSISVAK